MKKTGFLAGMAVAGCLLMAGPAAAQQLSFTTSVIKANPGQSLSIDVFLSDVPVDVAAVNFTIRVSEADAAKMNLAAATSTSPQDNAQLDYAFNTLTRTGVTSGVIQGNVTEFRGVIYPNSTTFTGFSADESTLVANVQIPISVDAFGELRLELVSEVDGNVGLLGVSDVNGVSLVPNGEDRPLGNVKRLLVNDANVLVGDFPAPTSNGCTNVTDFLYLLTNWQVTVNVTDFLNLIGNWQSGCN